MAVTNMLCPFSSKICSECAYYRGRHYYMSLCKNYRGYIGKSKKQNKKNGNHKKLPDFQKLEQLLEPWQFLPNPYDEQPVKRRVIDMENGTSKACNYEEAKTWDWENPFIIRSIGRRHIPSVEKFRQIVQYNAGKGIKTMDVYEGPRFILLGGG